MDSKKHQMDIKKPASQNTPSAQNNSQPKTPPAPAAPAASTGNKHFCLQWCAGFFVVLLLSSTLLTFGAYRITSEKVMKPMMAQTLNVVFRQYGTKETTRVVNYVNELYKHKAEIQNMQNTMAQIDPAKVQKDMSSMTPEQSQKYLQDTLVNPMYADGTKIIQPLEAVNTNAAIDAERLDFLSSANIKSNQVAKKWLIIEGGLLLVVLAVLILVSKRWGRIYVPGIAILVGSLPGLVLFMSSNWLIKRFVPSFFGKYANGPIYNELVKIIVYPSIDTIRNIYLIAAIVGAGLIVIGIVLALIFKPHPAH